MANYEADLYTIEKGNCVLSFKSLLNLQGQIEEKLGQDVLLQFNNGSIRAWITSTDNTKTLGEVVLQQGLVFKSKVEGIGSGDTIVVSGIFAEKTVKEGE